MFPQKQQISRRQFLVLVITMSITIMGLYASAVTLFWRDIEKRTIEIKIEREKKEKYIASQPIITKDARVVTKRLYVKGDRGSYTYYYVTFELSDGKRVEYLVTPEEYGLLVEGDKGKLSTQLTEYRGFKRQISP